MNDKHLSGEEKRKKMKEQFKKELLQDLEFKRKVQQMKKMSEIQKALESMNYEDDTDEWINKLNEKAAISDAKLEIAFDDIEQKAKDNKLEDELNKIIAEEIVNKTKSEMSSKKTLGDFGIDEEKQNGKPEDKNNKTLGDL